MADNLIATLATVYERAQQRGAISSGDEAWLIDNLGRVIEQLQLIGALKTSVDDIAAGATAEALANARADVAHTMAELARVTHGRDVLAAEVTALTRDFLAAVEAHAAAEAERDAARVAVSALTVRMAGEPVTAAHVKLDPFDDGD